MRDWKIIVKNLSSHASFNPQLRLENVSLQSKIGSQPILQEISAEVKTGDRIALVGISGAGKTSLLRLLNRLKSPSNGEIFFQGESYQKIPVVQLRQQITLVLSEAKLLGMSVKEALTYPLKLRGLSEAEITQRLTEWMERLEIPTDWLNRTEMQISTGQKQQIAIARALMIQPQILLLDEPLAALDVARQKNLLKILQQLTDHSTTMILATHQLDLIPNWGNRLWHLSQGKLVQDAPTQQINWQALKQQLITDQHQEAEEWDSEN